MLFGRELYSANDTVHNMLILRIVSLGCCFYCRLPRGDNNKVNGELSELEANLNSFLSRSHKPQNKFLSFTITQTQLLCSLVLKVHSQRRPQHSKCILHSAQTIMDVDNKDRASRKRCAPFSEAESFSTLPIPCKRKRIDTHMRFRTAKSKKISACATCKKKKKKVCAYDVEIT